MATPTLALAQLLEQRARLNRLNNGQKLTNDAEAARFINERGFVMLMPLAQVPLPDLSSADAAETWKGFDITDRAWAWKETLPGRKVCAIPSYY